LGHLFDKMIITVPNAGSYYCFKNARRNFERINTDHRYLFSPYTLMKCLYISGFYNQKFYFVTDYTYRSKRPRFIWLLKFPWRLLRYNYFKRRPLLRGTIVCECEVLLGGKS